MGQHPRASELKRFVQAIEAAGKVVVSVEVRWQDGAPVWRIETADGGRKPTAEERVDW